MNRVKIVQCVLTLLAVSLVAPRLVRAAAIGIDDTNPNDTITVSANDFEGGFSVNGTLIQQGLGNPGSATVSEAPTAGPLTFAGFWNAPGGVTPLSRTIYLVEGDGRTVSDIFTYSVSSDGFTGIIHGSFISDFENNLGTVPAGVSPSDVIRETSAGFGFSAPFLTGNVRSDVPEPATLSLIAIGGIALAGAVRRKRK